jgi:ubiquinone/menaquinone biosynthesis C-methylase UbiE
MKSQFRPYEASHPTEPAPQRFGGLSFFVARSGDNVDKQISFGSMATMKAHGATRMSSKPETQSIWDRYWQADRLASCFDVIGCNYDEALLHEWRAFFAALEDGARLLDLCTGNGAIALVAAEVSQAHAKSFHIEAVDSAVIDPPRYVTRKTNHLRAIRFHAETSVEALPFPDAAFDAVSSQYGIEYADLQKALAEAARVLAPAGRIRLVVHAAEGQAVRHSNSDIGDCRYLLLESDLFEAAEKAIRATWGFGRGPTAPTGVDRVQAEKAVAALNAGLEVAGERSKEAKNPLMYENVTSVLADTFNKRGYFPLKTLLDQVEAVRVEVLAHMGRLEALVAVAKSEADISGLLDDLSDLGFKDATYAAVSRGDDDDLVGWALSAVRL